MSDRNMIKETAEISASDNWVGEYLTTQGIQFFAFEGYTIKDDNVSMVLDRRRVSDLTDWSADEVFEEFSDGIGPIAFNAKLRMAELLSCPYALVLYDDDRVAGFSITRDGASKEVEFNSYAEFGEWTMEYRDLSMTKKFDESQGLPEFDKALRRNDVAWPGNLDFFWYDEDKDDVRAVAEFQTTKKASVANHSNNKFFSADRKRWSVIDTVSQQINRPLIIIVWSPNSYDRDVRIKKVDEIIYRGTNSGLHYAHDETVSDAGVEGNKHKIIELLQEVV